MTTGIEVLSKLRNGLKGHYGSIKVIQQRTGLSRQMIQMTLRGKRKNNLILKVAAEVLLEFQNKECITKKHINKTVLKALALTN